MFQLRKLDISKVKAVCTITLKSVMDRKSHREEQRQEGSVASEASTSNPEYVVNPAMAPAAGTVQPFGC